MMQVAFLVDGTASMQPWMDGLRDNIVDAAQELAALSNLDVRLALDAQHVRAVQALPAERDPLETWGAGRDGP